ncbi:MAG: transcriptional repressor [Alphaproteobacteria bacterium]|nr:transcriptional repressor [Alphaproteobacteria bacterium]
MSDQMTSLTKNQEMVLGALSHAKAPMSAYAILDELRSEGFRAPPQVYRALEKLVAGGLVHRLESLNAFVACSHEDCHTSGLIAFAICEQCGLVSEFSDQAVSTRLTHWIADHKFTNTKTTIEIRGDCGTCSVAG